MRWFNTIVNQPQVKTVVGAVKLLEVAVEAPAGGGKKEKGSGKKEKGGKDQQKQPKEEKKKDKKKEAPAPADADAGDPAPAPEKQKDPFAAIPKVRTVHSRSGGWF